MGNSQLNNKRFEELWHGEDKHEQGFLSLVKCLRILEQIKKEIGDQQFKFSREELARVEKVEEKKIRKEVLLNLVTKSLRGENLSSSLQKIKLSPLVPPNKPCAHSVGDLVEIASRSDLGICSIISIFSSRNENSFFLRTGKKLGEGNKLNEKIKVRLQDSLETFL